TSTPTLSLHDALPILPAERHAPAHVEHEHGRRARQRVRAVHDEVLGREPRHGLLVLAPLGRRALDAVHDGFGHVEIEDVTEVVWLHILGPLAGLSAARDGVVTKPVATQAGEQVTERLLADAPHASG